ncbi:MAG: ATP-binding protein [Coriobacteriia bacterium]|nr:ATP-binding protein [Coriobacteriia bacterium]
MKVLTVASGKGGTGKSTLSALLARLASDELRVALADADVEASNLPIALQVDKVACDEFNGGVRAVIDADACTGCALCEPVCRFDAITPKGSAYAVDGASCEGCTRCFHVCPAGAITLRRQHAGEVCTGVSSVGPMAFGQLRPAHDLSGRLVTEVRSRAVALGAQNGAELLIIDGPPGTGCPAIASLTGADLVLAVTEPTRSGAHDLGRLEELVRRFGLPLAVVLNKADLSKSGAREVRELCEAREMPLLAEVPFDPALVTALELLAKGEVPQAHGFGTGGMRIIREIWRQLSATLGLAQQASESR